MNVNELIQVNKDVFRENLLKYTRKAFLSLPKIENPKILDIGCGTGVPTLELARLCKCDITAIDIDENSLRYLEQKIKDLNLTKKIKTMNCSLFEIELPENSFDIIWAEGSIAVIGFKRGLSEWKSLIKNRGFLVLHDGYDNHDEKLKIIKETGYELKDYFIISHEKWWYEYYKPWSNQIYHLKNLYQSHNNLNKKLDEELKELEFFKKNQDGSIFYILKKI
ncbi:MAG: hypothetical protein CIT01_06510 [Methanobacterium sp. BRmetb2]|nr:MAG: hypothetical protein CIT01_06510 [Methanobacterium sp. BRmetb2]